MSSATAPVASSDSQSTVDAKIMADLDILDEKMDLCNSMLRPGGAGEPASSVKRDEALLQVIGFLEACAPRMIELVEAAAQGALTESVLMKCLEVNDRLTKMLSDIDTVAMTETAASTTAASAVTESLDDLLLDDDDSSDLFAQKPAVGVKSTGEEDEDDPFGNAVLEPTKMPATETATATAPVEIPAQTNSEDDFDSFFNERTSDAAPKPNEDAF